MAVKMATKDLENTEMVITSLFNSHINVLVCVLACMFCHQATREAISQWQTMFANPGWLPRLLPQT